MIIGVLGGGQLAWMLAQAGRPLGHEFVFLCPDEQACAAPLGEHLRAGFEDQAALASLAAWTDIVTYEFENVPVAAVRFLAERVTVHPSLKALTLAQDRLHEKRHFQGLGIPTPDFEPVHSLQDLQRAVARLGLPAVLKTRTQGYDGKGQAVLRTPEDLARVWASWGDAPAIVEEMVAFEREVSVIAVRAQSGETACYPLSENHHRDGVLRLSLSRQGDPMQALAEDYIKRLLDSLDYLGVLTLELFQAGDRLLANEMAPRVHNSGHWTIEGAATSQFENHLRAILGLPLGPTAAEAPAAMVNLIGKLPSEKELLAVPGAYPHFYGKAERPGRKLGHVTLTGGGCSGDEINRYLSRLLALAGEPALAERVLHEQPMRQTMAPPSLLAARA